MSPQPEDVQLTMIDKFPIPTRQMRQPAQRSNAPNSDALAAPLVSTSYGEGKYGTGQNKYIHPTPHQSMILSFLTLYTAVLDRHSNNRC